VRRELGTYTNSIEKRKTIVKDDSETERNQFRWKEMSNDDSMTRHGRMTDIEFHTPPDFEVEERI
jgi:hypothetical protein